MKSIIKLKCIFEIMNKMNLSYFGKVSVKIEFVFVCWTPDFKYVGLKAGARML